MKRWNLKGLLMRVMNSFWMIPSLLIFVAFMSAATLNWADFYYPIGSFDKWAWLFLNTPEGARSILATIAGSMVTVIGVILSAMIVVLALVSQQYGPRLMKNFIKDRLSQAVIGSLAGCFIYCIVTLKNIHSGGESFVPQVSVLLAVLFALLSIGLLIYFVQHIANSIQIQSIMSKVYKELTNATEMLFPQSIGKPIEDEAFNEQTLDKGGKVCLRSDRAGYLQLVNEELLLSTAQQNNCVIKLAVQPGDFIIKEALLAEVIYSEQKHDRETSIWRPCFVIGTMPTCEQDLLFPVRNLEEIAIRALSPGLNDPRTAIECIDYLTSALVQLAQKSWPATYRADCEGSLRVIATPRSWEVLLKHAYEHIHFHGRNDALVLEHIRYALKLVLAASANDQSKKESVEQLLNRLFEQD